MLRPSLTTAAIALLCTAAAAQGNIKSAVKPVTGPIKHAGVFHVASGKWTRAASLANVTGPDTIYNNTCSRPYYTVLSSGDWFQHRSRIPSKSGPTTDSLFYGSTNSAHRYDERPGCQNSYNVNGFQIFYCSSHPAAFDYEYDFANSYTVCSGGDMPVDYAITVTGLPGGFPTGGQRCWIADIDLSGLSGGGIVLSADGNGTYNGPSTADQFGWGFKPVTALTPADSTGPILAGNFTWTGGPFTGALTPCTGTDGTIWDNPIDLTEFGTGMASLDAFRDGGTAPAVGGAPGCYFFGGTTIHSDFYLKLYAAPNCPPPDPMTGFCANGVSPVVATCPCGNPQVPALSTKGCNNFAGGGTGGATLTGAGVASIAADTLQLNFANGVGTSVTVQFQGTTQIAAGTRSGAGIRCVGGTLKRIYKGNPVAGAISFPNNAVPVHTQSAAKGFTIVPPVTLYYYCAYRNAAANGQPGCPGLTFGFNTSNAGAVSWTP
jgi:hypothetical protein